LRIYEDLRGLQRRVGVAQVVVALPLALLVVYFWHLQVVRGRYFRELSENNRIRAIPIPAPRGPLFDRNGRILAENRSSFNVVLTTERRDDLRQALARIATLITFDPAEVEERLNKRGPRFRSLVVKSDATEEDVASVEARRFERPEASVEVVPLRSYPLGIGASHVLGHVGEVTDKQTEQEAFAGIEAGTVVGQTGLELQYNRELMGKDGLRRIIVNSRGVEVTEAERVAPVDGPSSMLTIDLDLQKAFEEAMAGQSGSVIALDPETGDILAYLSLPGYDPNAFSAGINPAEWGALMRDPEKPLINRVIQGQYPPGSAFKIINALAALQEGVITPATRFHCPGYLAVYGTIFRCHKAAGHGLVDVHKALALSCNVFFYQAGVKLEIARLAAWAKRLGLGSPTGIDLPHEASGLMPSPEWKMRVLKAPWYGGETVSVAIGQGQVSVTPLQMARLAAVIANGGRLVQPHLVKSVGGVPVPWEPPRDIGLKPETIRIVREGMRSVVAEGTGWRARIPGMEIAGKTGSAQVVAHARLAKDPKSAKLMPHGWFICFAPADKPRIAMAVLVEHGGSGGEAAAPVAHEILARYFGKGVTVADVPPGAVVDTEPLVEEHP
jgi:penicillin-binding protein 2